MPRFDASIPRSDTCSATLVTSIIASIASLVLSSDPPNARFFDAPTPRFDASMPKLSHARFLDASTSRFDASIPRFDTCFDPGFDHRSKIGVWPRRHSMLDACGFHGCFDLWVTSMIASIASWVLSFVVEELGCLDASIYSLRRYSLRHSLGCSMLRCFSASLECFWARLESRSNAPRLPCSLRCYSFRSLE